MLIYYNQSIKLCLNEEQRLRIHTLTQSKIKLENHRIRETEANLMPPKTCTLQIILLKCQSN
jgi:hypothetical protein